MIIFGPIWFVLLILFLFYKEIRYLVLIIILYTAGFIGTFYGLSYFGYQSITILLISLFWPIVILIIAFIVGIFVGIGNNYK